MGCCESKIAFEKHTEHTYLLPFEQKLGYKSITAKEFDNILHRYSLSGLMTYSQFTRALTTAGVNFHKLDGFYKYFIKESNSNKFEKNIGMDILSTGLHTSARTSVITCLVVYLTKSKHQS